jgi:hypothetical protein
MLPVVRQNPAARSRLPAIIKIPKDKEASIQLDGNSYEVIKVYTDGSAHGRMVGAAAILTRQGKEDHML